MTTSPASPKAHTPGGDGVPEPAARFRKKPVVIDAWQWNADIFGMPDWIPAYRSTDGRQCIIEAINGHMIIPTLEGDHDASPGDWIIKGVKGELYPCKPDIFEATYEPADRQSRPSRPDHEALIERLREVIASHWRKWNGLEQESMAHHNGPYATAAKIILQDFDAALSSPQPPAPAPLEQKETDNG